MISKKRAIGKANHTLFLYKMLISGQVTRRHPEGPAYRCFLSDLTGFTSFRRAGPARRLVGYRRN